MVYLDQSFGLLVLGWWLVMASGGYSLFRWCFLWCLGGLTAVCLVGYCWCFAGWCFVTARVCAL